VNTSNITSGTDAEKTPDAADDNHAETDPANPLQEWYTFIEEK